MITKMQKGGTATWKEGDTLVVSPDGVVVFDPATWAVVQKAFGTPETLATSVVPRVPLKPEGFTVAPEAASKANRDTVSVSLPKVNGRNGHGFQRRPTRIWLPLAFRVFAKRVRVTSHDMQRGRVMTAGQTSATNYFDLMLRHEWIVRVGTTQNRFRREMPIYTLTAKGTEEAIKVLGPEWDRLRAIRDVKEAANAQP